MNWNNLFERMLLGDPIEEIPVRPSNTSTIEYAIWRLWHAKTNDPGAALDHAILIRQCLRWMGTRPVRGDRLKEYERKHLEIVGVRLSLSGYIVVDPYRPAWLGEAAAGDELDALPQPASIDESFPAEEWLRRTTGKLAWRSHAQKEACWTVLTSQPGETNLIGLPTGAGKSLAFQVAAAFSNGLTVVIVPTVALGLDQLAVAKTLPTAAVLNPATFRSGDSAETVRDAVANRQCRLLFTSPEACVSGRLRSVLDQHASDAWLQWVVVDEAHIVESWGADFRIEFQLLGALVRDWRERSANRLRTVLLSATFSESTQDLLRGLFVGQRESWKANVVQRLRPEIHYHIQRAANAEEQAEWVTDALLHLPRPTILYVTEKEKARQWHIRAIQLGFKRVECFHGDTLETERDRIMDLWRSDRVDIMVATSAFGMGVDKPDVRAVIHACFPESIDRFYQEVGRSGRDGATAQSLLLYTERDKKIGRSLAPTLLKPETVSDRWEGLWDSRRVVDREAEIFQVRSGARRQQFVGVRTYQENVRWNKRLIQMLHRARLLTIVGLHTEKIEDGSEEYVEWITVKGLQFSALDHHVGELLSADRTSELNSIYRGFTALENCADGLPVCRELQKYYGGHVVRTCGSCWACRVGSEPRRTCGMLQWSEDSPHTNPTVYVVPMTSMNTGNGRTEWIMAVRKTIDQKVAYRFVVAETDFNLATSLFYQGSGTGPLRQYRLDSPHGGELPTVGARDQIVALHLTGFRSELAAFNRHGAKCSHWIPHDETVDSRGRSRFTQEHGARLYEGVESWLFENQTAAIA